jgi:hypothetical protein
MNEEVEKENKHLLVMYGVFITTLGGQLKHSGSGQVARM